MTTMELPVDAGRRIEEPAVRGDEVGLTLLQTATATLYNGLGHYERALGAAEQADEQWQLEDLSLLVLPELIEAASRSGERERAVAALERLSASAHASGADWALGLELRSRALLSDGCAAELLYREAIGLLEGTHLPVALARAHLVYGEWLRRAGRRVDAREQLRTALALLIEQRIDAFADRARRELLATGETVRKRNAETRDDLTAQESEVARLAGDGHTNPEIGARLFISPRTVEWHLSKVYVKLGIGSRRELGELLLGPARTSPA